MNKMKPDKTPSKTIDQYIKEFPITTQKILRQVRDVIKKAAPKAAETISYGIPTFTLNGNLVHFAGYKNHIGFYPAPSGIKAFAKELSVYEGAKGSVKFPIDKPIPVNLITKIVKFRVKENVEKAGAKNSTSKDSFLSELVAPARRALENKGITTVQKLARFSEKEILELHGMGQGTLPKLRSALKSAGLSFKHS
jgi:uncharacterized protein YdhG (YjbR/CyaY superfamily)